MDLKGIVETVLDCEIRGLNELKQNFDFKNVNEVIAKIYNLNGKLILSGIGKSGYISKKIAASLCSIGCPAIFLHSGEALHGDLGIIASNDIVLIFSNSGEGNELKKIIEYCERFNVMTVGISRRKSSYLIQKSNISINLPDTPEVSNLDIPTTSTIMMLAFGDILTIALKEKKQLSHEDYLIYHPGGSIGLKGIKASDLMLKTDQLVILKNDSFVVNALLAMLSKRVNFALIVDNKDELVGIITDTIITGCNLNDKTQVQDIISNNYKILSGEMRVAEILGDKNPYEYFIIMEHKKLIGVLPYENIKSLYKC
jgi:arabinose-5-phosphate isomerase